MTDWQTFGQKVTIEVYRYPRFRKSLEDASDDPGQMQAIIEANPHLSQVKPADFDQQQGLGVVFEKWSDYQAKIDRFTAAGIRIIGIPHFPGVECDGSDSIAGDGPEHNVSTGHSACTVC
jgi:hypothetical protein